MRSLLNPRALRFLGFNRFAQLIVLQALSVQFAGPDHESFRVNGYWDGGNTWKVRFVPTRPGRWSYRVDGNAADAGLAGQTGSFTVVPAAGDNPLDRHGGILQVSSDRHYLTYSDGKPFFWLDDTWWLCPGDQLPIDTSTRPDCPSMFKALIDKRRQQGFTVVHMAFLGKGWTPRLDALIASRRQPGWNVDFWRTVDRYFDYANDAGLVPVVGMSHLRNFCESVEWWKLRPCPETIVTQDGAKRENRPSARSDGDRLYVVWFPQGSGATSPASLRIAGVKDASFRGTWFNPRTGESRPLATELSAGNGVCPLPARPDEEDWVLRMECHEKRLP